MSGFEPKFIDELKSKNDIVEVIGKYVQLEKRGDKFWGRCPFHQEKTGSFCVNQREQYYYCFGCKKTGDVVNFVSEIESLDFNDTIKFLAERVHMPLPEIRLDDEKIRAQRRQRDRLLEILKETAKFYVLNLHSEKGSPFVSYALRRKLTSDTITRFGIGASLDYESLPKHLLSKGYTKEEMVLAGVCRENKNGVYDPLAKRFIIPMIDAFNNVVAFTGRKLDESVSGGKYVNTSETQIFSKRNTLFNINNLKKLKNEQGLDGIIMVEGHMDVVSLYQAGIKNVVASMGTALTKEQARILKRYSDKIYICYDGDFAGQTATIRGLEILRDEGLDVKVVSMPDGLDPDEVVSKYGVEDYKRRLTESLPLIDFKLEVLTKTYDLNSIDGKRKFIQKALSVIRESEFAPEQEDLLKRVRDLTGTTYESLRRELYNESAEIKPINPTPEFSDNSKDKTVLASRFVLYAFLFNKKYVVDDNVDINEIQFSNPTHLKIQAYIADKNKRGEKIKFSDLYEDASDIDREEISYMAGLEMDEKKKYDEAVFFYDCVKILRKEKITVDIARLNTLFSQETDLEKRKEIATELQSLLQEKNILSKN